MKVITPGHRYELANFEPNSRDCTKGLAGEAYQLCLAIEGLPASEQQTQLSIAASNLSQKLTDLVSGNQTLQFIEKVPDPSHPEMPGVMMTLNNGTTNEDVLAALIDRVNFLNGKFPCRENSIALTHMETALLWLNKRTADRVKRGVEGQHKA